MHDVIDAWFNRALIEQSYLERAIPRPTSILRSEHPQRTVFGRMRLECQCAVLGTELASGCSLQSFVFDCNPILQCSDFFDSPRAAPITRPCLQVVLAGSCRCMVAVPTTLIHSFGIQLRFISQCHNPWLPATRQSAHARYTLPHVPYGPHGPMCCPSLVGILVERFKLSRRILRIFSSNKYFNFILHTIK